MGSFRLEQHGMKKIYRGAFDYYSDDKKYAEELFEVFKDPKESGLKYESQFNCRTPSGEFLIIKTVFFVNKEYIPTKLRIERSLGKESVEEKFDFNNKVNQLNYVFSCNGEDFRSEASTTPKFHIATPTAVTSVLFVMSKRVEINSKTAQGVVTSINDWEYVGEPVSKIIALERVSLTSSTIKIGDKNLDATEYAIYPTEDGSVSEDLNTDKVINVYLSKYVGIPYMIKEGKNKRIEIRYLNDIEG